MTTMTPHADVSPQSVACAVLTVSDSRTPETDKSGQLICSLLTSAGHTLLDYQITPDEPEAIQAIVEDYGQQPAIAAVIINGGTGIAPRDTTYDAIARLLEKTLPGFGEIFRALSYEEIGSRAIASRAIAGTYQSMLIFSLPGSSNAVRLAMESLILPELQHLVNQLHS